MRAIEIDKKVLLTNGAQTPAVTLGRERSDPSALRTGSDKFRNSPQHVQRSLSGQPGQHKEAKKDLERRELERYTRWIPGLTTRNAFK